MQSLQDIFGNKDFDVPPEITIIKDFVRKRLHADVAVTLHPQSITLTVPSASMAGTLRSYLYPLKKELNTEKKIFIRIG